MRAAAFWKAVTMDETNLLERLIAVLADSRIRYCVIGGQAVNAYAEPLVSLDLDLAIAADQIGGAQALLAREFVVHPFPHSLNVSAPGSNLRVQIQLDPRYAAFVERATEREILGVLLRVAALEDVLQGKIWAALDPDRRPSKRRKDLLDIERLVEAHPELATRLPEEIRRLL